MIRFAESIMSSLLVLVTDKIIAESLFTEDERGVSENLSLILEISFNLIFLPSGVDLTIIF